MSEICLRVDLGRMDYRKSWNLQKDLVARRRRGDVPDLLLFVEHPPTYTLGQNGKRAHLLANDEELARAGATFIETDRGGDITYHGPGQVVGYGILDLQRLRPDVHLYVRRLEEVLIRALARWGIASSRIPGLTGVWHGDQKIAAIGVRVSRWITSHGFALNVATDLSRFESIVPCGIVGKRVTSVERVLGRPVAAPEMRDTLTAEWGHVFGRMMLATTPSELDRWAGSPEGPLVDARKTAAS
jgi:lipoate-protein ligase B